MDRPAIQRLYDYTDWAWRQVGGVIEPAGDEALLRPVPGSGWPALRDCLGHYVFAYDRWLSVLLDRPARGVEASRFTTWAEIDAARAAFRAELKTLLDSLADEELTRVREFAIDGKRMPYSYAELFTHLLLHERGHHGDITTLLYQLGIEQPWIDYLFFVTEGPGLEEGSRMDRASLLELLDVLDFDWKQQTAAIGANTMVAATPIPGSGWPALRDPLAHVYLAFAV
jgi:uncharacterized damage-inducible protein DinB